MDVREALSCTAFAGSERIAHGDPQAVALACKALIDAGDARTVLAFDDVTLLPRHWEWLNALRFEECSESWPLDVRDHARALAADAWL